MVYRKAEADEAGLLAENRKRQLVDEGIAPSIDIDAELDAFFREKLADGSLVEWIAVEDGEIVATAGIVFYDFPPTYTNRSGRKGYVTNMYTRPDFRGRGIATELIGKIADEGRARGVNKLMLGASRMGRPVYQKFGFHDSESWMEMTL